MLFPEDCNFLSVGLRQLRARARRLGLLPARCAHASSQTVQRQWQAIARVVSESSKISNHADCQRLLGTSVRVPRRQAPGGAPAPRRGGGLPRILQQTRRESHGGKPPPRILQKRDLALTAGGPPRILQNTPRECSCS